MISCLSGSADEEVASAQNMQLWLEKRHNFEPKLCYLKTTLLGRFSHTSCRTFPWKRENTDGPTFIDMTFLCTTPFSVMFFRKLRMTGFDMKLLKLGTLSKCIFW